MIPTESLRDLRSTAPAVVRAAALLAVLAEPGVEALGLSDLARRLDLPKSTVANLCSALEQVGFVRRVDGRFELGHRLLELGAAYSDRIDIIHEFKAATGRLRWASQETIQLAILEGAEIIYLARHDGTQPVRLAAGLGRRMPAPCTALGKAMLAELDPAEVRARIGALPTFPVLTPKSKHNMAELMEDLDGTRARGYAIDDEENSVGVVCYGVALPTVGPNSPRRAISVTLLKARETADLRERLVGDLRDLAADLSPHL
ncbi:MAG: IclR family transcriptional regulator [Candidatus Limnocylindrales bacterium]|jgi:DNA-binding IclR family transcriptional regulator